MLASCARAAELGLPSVAFTEHADLTAWAVPEHQRALLPPHFRARMRPGGLLVPPDLDIAGYLAAVARCRERFPGLRVMTGVELSEPHRHPGRVARLLATGGFDRVLGSVHTVRDGDDALLVDLAMRDRDPAAVVRDYLAEVLEMLRSGVAFEVLAHVDYPVRSWPDSAGPFRPGRFEEPFREVLAALAATGRALEVNTKVPMAPELVRWWADAGGTAVLFGSDAHEPGAVGHGFAAAATTAQSYGFHPGPDPAALWLR